MDSTLNFLIVDDHVEVRRAVRSILAGSYPGASVAETDDSENVLLLIAHLHCDVLILDLHLPGKNGLELLREVKRQHPSLPVVVLSVQACDQAGDRCLRAGAASYIHKDDACEQLPEAVSRALAAHSC